MKKIIYILILSSVVFAVSGCDSFLDQQPIDKITTSDDVFAKKSTTDRALYRLFTFYPDYASYGAAAGRNGGEPFNTLADEIEVSFVGHSTHQILKGSMSPSATYYDKYGGYYRMLRDCNYFLQNVDKCPDSEISQEEKLQYKFEARFCRAYYYYLLVRTYGPVPLLKDRILYDEDDMNIGRASFKDCVDYIESELAEIAPQMWREQIDSKLGRPTMGMALALRAKVLLFAASELYNPREASNRIYKDWKSNADGKNLISEDYGTYNNELWKKAADAAKQVIDMREYELVKVLDEEGNIDPYQSLYQIYTTKFNKEIIFGAVSADAGWYKRIMPRALTGCWGGVCPSQKVVDAFAMKNGIYPVIGYEGATENANSDTPVIDPKSGYTESGSTSGWTHPFDKVSYEIYNMYKDREPRFYVDVTFPAMMFPYGVTSNEVKNTVEVQTYKNGNSGWTASDSDNRSVNGYIVRKGANRGNNPAQNTWVTPMVWPVIRLAGVYLDYVEALIEYGDMSNPDILKYWNMIRERAGVPDIETIYPEVATDQAAARKYLRRERNVELCFEFQRYFDLKRWMLLEEATNDYVYGMDINQTSYKPIGNCAFWKRTAVTDWGKRVFGLEHYQFPIPQSEMDRNTAMEQAPYYK